MPIRSLSKAKEEISRAKELGADKQAQPEYEEAKKYLLKTHELATAEEPEVEAVKNSADYARNKASDAIEKTLPSIVSKAKEDAGQSIKSAENANAENFASQEFNQAKELLDEGDSASGQAQAQLNSYPNLEDSESKNKARSEAFDTYEVAHKKYLDSIKASKKAKAISLTKTQVLLDSATETEERLPLIDKYSNGTKREQINGVKKELNEGIANVQDGKVKDGQTKIDNAKKSTDEMYSSVVRPYAQNQISTAKDKIQDAGKEINSIDKSKVGEDEELSNSLLNAEDNLKAANESLNSSTEFLDKEKYEDSIEHSKEAIELADKSILISKNIAARLEKKKEKVTHIAGRSDTLEIGEDDKDDEIVYIEPDKKNKAKPKPVKKKKRLRSRTYKVKSKNPTDTLYRLSRKFYGSDKYWKKIYKANKSRIKNPNKIYPNQVLIIPPK
ncbi:MAG: LysM peptidoglycan-binding domain-containing protein [Leptospiraceae bacterium]|nr:LysM peptidoglycan-binding domain-containing protein [Leptospiraceae bacterium]MCP5493144.1 LysM peptidoglycan-binding domain-containing protein [Leptospiraceae bacterium]